MSTKGTEQLSATESQSIWDNESLLKVYRIFLAIETLMYLKIAAMKTGTGIQHYALTIPSCSEDSHKEQ